MMDDKKFDELLTNSLNEEEKMPEKINQLFSKFEMEVKEMEENKARTEQMKKINKENKRMKRASIVAALLGLFGACGIAYATVVPQEWKNSLTSLVNNYFGVHLNEEQLEHSGVQEKTFESIIESEKSDAEKYSVLLDPDLYIETDGTRYVLIESNYEQYDFFGGDNQNDKIILEKFDKPIEIKIGIANTIFMQQLDLEMTVLDENGNVKERKEPTIEEVLEYQNKQLKDNWDLHYHGEDGRTYNDLFVKITGMTVMNGNNTTDEDYNNFARAKKIKVTFNNEKEEIINLQDSKEAQFIDLEYMQQDISKPINIKVEVLETYEGLTSQDTYIADIQFGITSNILQGR